jgi:hypothetical protein
MDYDRLALLLLVRGSNRGFRKALKESPTAALSKASFSPGEVAQLLAALNKIKATRPLVWKSAFERLEASYVYQKIVVGTPGQSASTDDWDTC